MGIEATEESFKSLSERKSPAIIHIATHGFFFSDPKRAKRNNETGGAFVFQQSDIPLIPLRACSCGANNAWKNRPVSGVQDRI